MMTGNDAIRMTGLCKAFHDIPVLRHVHLRVAVGESIAVMGENGAGKTTLLRCLAGIVRWDRGQLWLHGKPVTRSGMSSRDGSRDGASHAESCRDIGMISHACQLYPNLSLCENLLFAARMTGLPHPRKQAHAWLERIGLAGQAQWLPRRLSHGMRRRVSIARGLIHQPSILFMDEPFSGLDRQSRQWLADLLARLQRQQKSICFTTHDPRNADQCADRVLALQNGVLREIATDPNSAHEASHPLIAPRLIA